MQAVSVSPFRCRMWSLHDRLESNVTEESCKAEIDSFLKHGQFVPVLGRTVRNDPDYDVELIYGARRLFVARHINIPLTVELRDLSDLEAIVAMDIENRQRTDISPYERALSYASWIRGGFLQSQDDIARTLKVSPSQVSRLLKLARLPSVVVAAFNSPLEICEAWGIDLMDALDDPDRRQATLQKARAIGCLSPRPPGREVYKSLAAAAVRGRKVKARTHDEVVKDRQGLPLFRIRHQTSAIALLLPTRSVSAKLLEAIRDSVAQILQRAIGQELDVAGENSDQQVGAMNYEMSRHSARGHETETAHSP